MARGRDQLERPDGTTHVLKEEGDRGVYLVAAPTGERLVVKRWPRSTWTRVKHVLGIAPAQRQLAGAQLLRRAGVPTPEPLGPVRVTAERPPRYEIRLRWVEGESLLDRLRRADETEQRSLGAAMREVLARLDAAGLFHRDAKPSNFILSSEGELVAIDPVGVRLARDRTSERARYAVALLCEFGPGEREGYGAFVGAALSG